MTYYYCMRKESISLKQRYPASAYIGIAVARAQCLCFGPGLVRTGTVTKPDLKLSRNTQHGDSWEKNLHSSLAVACIVLLQSLG